MSLYDTQNEFKKAASRLPVILKNGKYTNKYEDYNITDLADGYCKATDEHDESKRNMYLSALILRFWYVIDKNYQRVKSCGYDRESVFDNLYDCIEVACQYRAWQNPDKHTNAQACINQVLAGRGVPAMVYEANLQKSGPNYMTSLDDELDDDSSATRADLIADESSTMPDDRSSDVVQELIDNNKIVEAIIADTIANKDVFKHEKKTVKEIQEDGTEYKYVKHSSEFWPFKLVQELNGINEEYIDYFTSTYDIDDNIFNAAIEDINKANNQKKYRMLDKALPTIKEVFLNY